MKMVLLIALSFILNACATSGDVDSYRSEKADRKCAFAKNPAQCRLGNY